MECEHSVNMATGLAASLLSPGTCQNFHKQRQAVWRRALLGAPCSDLQDLIPVLEASRGAVRKAAWDSAEKPGPRLPACLPERQKQRREGVVPAQAAPYLAGKPSPLQGDPRPSRKGLWAFCFLPKHREPRDQQPSAPTAHRPRLIACTQSQGEGLRRWTTPPRALLISHPWVGSRETLRKNQGQGPDLLLELPHPRVPSTSVRPQRHRVPSPGDGQPHPSALSIFLLEAPSSSRIGKCRQDKVSPPHQEQPIHIC